MNAQDLAGRWTIATVREHLPPVMVQDDAGAYLTYPIGRMADYAQLHTRNGRGRFEVAWQTLADCLNSGRSIQSWETTMPSKYDTHPYVAQRVTDLAFYRDCYETARQNRDKSIAAGDEADLKFQQHTVRIASQRVRKAERELAKARRQVAKLLPEGARWEPLRNLENLYTGHFFATNAKRFFRSRVPSYVIVDAYNRWIFVTSERFDDSSPRLYTVRLFQPDIDRHDIKTIGSFQQYETNAQAWAAARRLIWTTPEETPNHA